VIGIPPEITSENSFYWEGMSRGQVLVEQCTECETFMHPGRGICRSCQGRNLRHVPLAGPATIEGITVNWQRWAPALDVPYGLAEVTFLSFPGVRVLGRLRGFDLEELTVGQLVDVSVEEGPAGTMVPSFVPLAG
jgi:uncharacterized OB-fold protein